MTQNRADNTERESLILIIDNVPQNIQVLGTILEAKNYKIALASNEHQAFELIDDIKPDLILLNIMIPELDGFEVCRKLKNSETTEKVPVIFLTAKTNADDIVMGFEVGASDYVSMPFNASELLARVYTNLELKKVEYERNQKEKLQGIIEITGEVCHELNQPLQAIYGYSELLMMDSEDDNPLNDKIKLISEQVDRMGEITKKLMTIARYNTIENTDDRIVNIDQNAVGNNSRDFQKIGKMAGR